MFRSGSNAMRVARDAPYVYHDVMYSTIAAPEALLVDAAEAINGEGPQWDDLRNRLWWVDMRGPSLRAFEPAGCRSVSWQMPAWIGCFGLLRDGRIVCALRTGLALFDPEDVSMRSLAGAPYDQRRFCFNDGGCDRDGHFLVGPMLHPLARDVARDRGAREAPLQLGSRA